VIIALARACGLRAGTNARVKPSTAVGLCTGPSVYRANVDLAHEYKPAAILIEDTVLGTAMIDELERLGLPVVQVTPKGDKKSRMQMHIPKFANGQIQFPREKPGCADVVRQLLDFPGGRLTDIVDSISQALTYEVSECQWNDTNLENFARFNAALGGGFW
jgi:predicted phage terminase large subunit-like protein